MKKSELKAMFVEIPTSFGLGHRGQNGTLFTLKEPLRIKEDEALIKELEVFLMSQSFARSKAKEMKRSRQELFCMPAFRDISQSPELVYSFNFRDMKEIAD